MKRLILFFFALFIIPTFAMAHRMDSAISALEINDNGNVEITHRIFAHDLEHTFDLSAVGIDFFDSEDGQKMIGDYLLDKFKLEAIGQKQLNIKYIGSETDGDLVYSYFTTTINPDTKTLAIKDEILHEFSSQQQNFVNVHFKGRVNSLQFSGGDGTKTVNLQ